MVRSARFAICAMTSVVEEMSKPTSSLLSPIMMLPSAVWRSSVMGNLISLSVFCVTRIWPFCGRTGWCSPTSGASFLLPSPAASTSRGARN